MNCVVLAHLVIKDLFDYQLPSELRCTEMYLDSTHLKLTPGEPHELEAGDLIWFGRSASPAQTASFRPQYNSAGELVNWRHFWINHVGIATGEDLAGEPLVLHSTPGENTTVWPLHKFSNVERYRTIWGVSRLVATATI